MSAAFVTQRRHWRVTREQAGRPAQNREPSQVGGRRALPDLCLRSEF